MQIKDMTPQELQSLIRNTVDDTLDEYFGDPDEGKQVKMSYSVTFEPESITDLDLITDFK